MGGLRVPPYPPRRGYPPLHAPRAPLAPLAAAAKVYCSEALTQAASEMIQLHGAIGITWEHQAHRYLKRAHGGRYLFGTPARHLATIAASVIDR
jgi:alkylation response protein AidB-like acyl-CoA dehydrogenase